MRDVYSVKSHVIILLDDGVKKVYTHSVLLLISIIIRKYYEDIYNVLLNIIF